MSGERAYLNLDKLPANAIGLTLHRIDSRERLHSCVPVIFNNGRPAVNTVLRRAALSGKVDVGGKIENHFADVVTHEDGSWEETVALDAASYRSLKTHWMRTPLVKEPSA